MADQENKKKTDKKDRAKAQAPAPEPAAEASQQEAAGQEDLGAERQKLQEQLDQEREAHLRLAAEYDNFRKRTQKEKDCSYQNGRADTVEKLLPVYDNLERALNQPTQDAAFKKGVEMTMNELVKIFASLEVEIFGAAGETFDPNLHNAVMHTEDESAGENTISQVFQKGIKVGEKVVRFAMVQVAN